MAARVTQEGVEVLVLPDPSLRRGRVTQLGVEVMADSTLRRARVTQLGVELLLPNEAITPEPPPAAAGRSFVVVAG